MSALPCGLRKLHSRGRCAGMDASKFAHKSTVDFSLLNNKHPGLPSGDLFMSDTAWSALSRHGISQRMAEADAASQRSSGVSAGRLQRSQAGSGATHPPSTKKKKKPKTPFRIVAVGGFDPASDTAQLASTQASLQSPALPPPAGLAWGTPRGGQAGALQSPTSVPSRFASHTASSVRRAAEVGARPASTRKKGEARAKAAQAAQAAEVAAAERVSAAAQAALHETTALSRALALGAAEGGGDVAGRRPPPSPFRSLQVARAEAGSPGHLHPRGQQAQGRLSRDRADLQSVLEAAKANLAAVAAGRAAPHTLKAQTRVLPRSSASVAAESGEVAREVVGAMRGKGAVGLLSGEGVEGGSRTGSTRKRHPIHDLRSGGDSADSSARPLRGEKDVAGGDRGSDSGSDSGDFGVDLELLHRATARVEGRITARGGPLPLRGTARLQALAALGMSPQVSPAPSSATSPTHPGGEASGPPSDVLSAAEATRRELRQLIGEYPPPSERKAESVSGSEVVADAAQLGSDHTAPEVQAAALAARIEQHTDGLAKQATPPAVEPAKPTATGASAQRTTVAGTPQRPLPAAVAHGRGGVPMRAPRQPEQEHAGPPSHVDAAAVQRRAAQAASLAAEAAVAAVAASTPVTPKQDGADQAPPPPPHVVSLDVELDEEELHTATVRDLMESIQDSLGTVVLALALVQPDGSVRHLPNGPESLAQLAVPATLALQVTLADEHASAEHSAAPAGLASPSSPGAVAAARTPLLPDRAAAAAARAAALSGR